MMPLTSLRLPLKQRDSAPFDLPLLSCSCFTNDRLDRVYGDPLGTWNQSRGLTTDWAVIRATFPRHAVFEGLNNIPMTAPIGLRAIGIGYTDARLWARTSHRPAATSTTQRVANTNSPRQSLPPHSEPRNSWSPRRF